ncbi:unnamed protein product [Aphanomyces euteiches]
MFQSIFRTKPIDVINAKEQKEELRRELGLWDLIAIGVGGTVGSGVFATTGDIISGAAGPAAFLSWMIAGVSCILSGFAYMEMSSLVPSSGSTLPTLTKNRRHAPIRRANRSEENAIPYSFAGGFDYVGYSAAKLIVHIGETGTMPIVVFIAFLAQPRLLYAMSVDGLLPQVFSQVDSNGNLFWGTLLSGTALAFGILVSFIMTNSALIVVRTRESSPQKSYSLTGTIVALSCAAMFVFQKSYVDRDSAAGLVISMVFLAATFGVAAVIFFTCPQNQGEPNMFRAPLVPFVPMLAIVVNWYLIAQLNEKDIARGCIWIAAAIVSYFLYGFRNSAGRTGWVKTLNHDVLCLNEVRPSMNYMVGTGDLKANPLHSPSKALLN